ncbi:MAG: DUF3795 domain-containing protein [Anaerolineales bacterium]|nr:DUF3795 domain-containing protein [Anaerolineales bacterium]
MKPEKPLSAELIAPCGMNCAICSRYLSFLNGLKRSQCSGCRPGHVNCTYLFAKCSGVNHQSVKEAVFCFECDQYPCAQIKRMDKRYQKSYGMSVVENLEWIKEKGMESFLENQDRKYRCPGCGGMISIHNRKCFSCDTVTRLADPLS